MNNLITKHIDIWTVAQTQKTNGAGRGNGSANSGLYGIKKLRELILELAVRGKLVPQNLDDEPARVLLEKIAKKKALLIKEGKIKKHERLPGISEDEKPFALPNSWVWTRIGDIGHDWGQKTPDNDFIYIEVSGIDNTTGNIKQANRLTAAEAPSRARKIVKCGTVIYSTVRPYLRNISIIDQIYSPEPIASTAFAVLHPFQRMPGKFFTTYLRSPSFVNYVESVQMGIAYPAINDRQFFNGLIPIPPLAEQHRIVAKVDELMAICDQLERQQIDNNSTHQTLVETLLATLTSAANVDEAAEVWQRIAGHFDILFTTEQSIDSLQQTILQLAVMGKLVPQDTNDEPASVLLQKIAKEKTRLVKEDGLRTSAKNAITEDEEFVGKPEGWEYCRLGNLAKFIDYRGRTPKKVESGITLITAKNVRYGYLSREPKEYISETEYQSWMTRGIPRLNDILFTTEAPLGNVAIVNIVEKFALAQRVICFQLHESEIAFFLKILIMSKVFQNILIDKATGMTATGIKAEKLKEVPVAIPPLAEQHRIVAKVDELMALCDRLKARLQDAQTTQIQLADAVVAQAVT